ncbi:auxilin-like clathrin-binding protein required for normal clathrin function, partial [Coemansia biformis]
MAFDPLATLPPPATGPNGGLPMRGLGGSPAPAPAPAPAHIASISDDEPIPMDSYPAAATQPEPFVDKDFEIAQVADYGFTVDQARAALEITGSPRAAIQLLREQKAATRQAPGGQSAVENRSNTGKSRLRTPYNDEPRRRYSSSSGDDDGGDGHYYNPRRNDSSNSRGAQRAGNGADSLLASANEIGASVWKQANSWFETGKKKFMEMQETVTEQHWPVARADGGWSRPGRDAEYMSASSQRRRNYDTSSDDDDDHYPARKSPVEAAVPSVPGHLLVMCNTAKADANEKFKLGQFGDAIAGYTQAIAQVSQHSAQHPLLILLYNNRALAYTRNGEARMALTDCSQALQLCTAYQANGTIDLGD